MTDTLFFIDEDEVLAHHGVKGMKWGVRKQRAASGGAGSTKKRKGLSRKQKAAIAGVLGTAAAAGAGYYLHKSGKGKKIAALAKKHGASAKDFAKGKGRNLGAQARVKQAQAKRFARAQSANAKGAAEKLKTTKARRAATGGVSGAKSAAGMAARSVKSKAGAAARSVKSKAGAAARSARSAAGGAAKSTASVKTPGKALQVAPRGVGYRKLHTTGTKVVRPKGAAADKLVKASVAGLATGVGGGALQYAAMKAMSGGKKKRGRSRKRRR